MPGWVGAAAAMFVVGWGGNQFTPLLVMYEQRQGFTALTTSTLLFAYVLGMVPALLASGAISARLGRRRMVVPGIAISIAGSMLLAFAAASPALLFTGRFLSGIGLGIGMVVGGVWVKELSNRPYATNSAAGAGARRAAMSLTAGFGIGAAVAGAMAQWLPAPTSLAFLLHAGLSVPALVMAWRSPETAGPLQARTSPQTGDTTGAPDSGAPDSGALNSGAPAPGSGRNRPRIHRLYFLKVLPCAPWVIAALGISYAVLPGLMKDEIGHLATAFSALLCLLSLGAGFFSQRIAARLSATRKLPTTAIGFTVFLTGVLLAAVCAQVLNAGLIIVAAVVLGTGYGLMLVGALEDIERIAAPARLAWMTAVFYSLAYTGFGVPALLAWIRQSFNPGYPEMLLALAAVATALVSLGGLILGLLNRRRPAPGHAAAPAPAMAASSAGD